VLSDMLGVEGMSLNELLREADIQLHGVRLNALDLSSMSHSLAVTVRGTERAPLFHVTFNAYWEPLSFELPRPAPGDGSWRRWIDTYRDAPEDIHDGLGPSVETPSYTVQERSLVVLFALGGDGTLPPRLTPPPSAGGRS